MELTVAVSILVCLTLGSGLVLAARRLASAGSTLPETADWIDRLSVERYRPMLRLLNDEELRFLRSQPGFTPELSARYRRQRSQIFRGYLRSLSGDFQRLTLAVQLLMLQAGADRTDLALVLIRSRLTFAGAMLAARVRLTLYACGLGTVNAGGLLRQFDSMRLELRTRVPSAVPAGA